MLLNYIKIAFRNLVRHKVYSLINILGLAIGIAAVILIFLYIILENSYDNFHVNKDRIFRVSFRQYQNKIFACDNNSFFAGVGPVIKSDIPEVEEYTRISGARSFYLIYNDKAFEVNNIVYAESTFFSLFDFNLIIGDKDIALKSPDSIVLTEGTARKFFGDKNPIGEIIYDNNNRSFVVTGVTDDPPINSHIEFNALISFSTLYDDPDNNISWSGAMTYYTYVMPYKNVAPSAVEAKLPALMDKVNQIISIPNIYWEAYLQPLGDLHLHYDNYSFVYRIYLYIFASIALFILFIACINFINLTTAISAKRAKEVGIRKVLGAHKKTLVMQFLSESVVMSIFALAIALVFVELALPKYNELIERQISMADSIGFSFILGLAAIIIIAGIIAGLYPAFRLSSFQPIKILKGETAAGRPKVALKNILVVIQFVISISLITSTFLINSQLDYFKGKDLGFDKENVVVLSLKNKEMQAHAEEIKNEMKKIPGVIGASASSQAPSRGFIYNGCLPEGADTFIFTAQVAVDEDYLELFNLKIVQGRTFNEEISTDKDKYIINESFVRSVGWEDPIGKMIKRGINHEVIGVVKDFNFAPLYQEITPLIIMRQPESGRYKVISIKIAGGKIKETLGKMKKIWEKFEAHIPFEYYFLDEGFEQIYEILLRFEEIFFYFSIFAIFIAMLGLFGLVAYTIEQRTKEIGIRKVLGASFSSIIILLAGGFVLPVIIANLIAIPATYWFINNLLELIAYRIEVGPYYFILAGAIALFIAVITITFHAIKAAFLNPVKSLRYE